MFHNESSIYGQTQSSSLWIWCSTVILANVDFHRPLRDNLTTSKAFILVIKLIMWTVYVYGCVVVKLWPMFGGKLTKPDSKQLFYIPQVDRRLSVYLSK